MGEVNAGGWLFIIIIHFWLWTSFLQALQPLPHPPPPTPNHGKSGVGLGQHVLPPRAARRWYLFRGQTKGLVSKAVNLEANPLAKKIGKASQQLAAKREGLGLQGGSHITKLDGSHLRGGLGDTRSGSLCSCCKNLGGRQSCDQIPAPNTTPASKLAQQNGLLLPSPPALSPLSLHPTVVSSDHTVVGGQDCWGPGPALANLESPHRCLFLFSAGQLWLPRRTYRSNPDTKMPHPRPWDLPRQKQAFLNRPEDSRSQNRSLSQPQALRADSFLMDNLNPSGRQN